VVKAAKTISFFITEINYILKISLNKKTFLTNCKIIFQAVICIII